MDEDIWNLIDNLEYEKKKEKEKNENKNNLVIEKSKKTCINCNSFESIKLDTYKGYMVCEECGFIANDVIDSNIDWKSYNNDDSNNSNNASNRCGCPSNPYLPKSSLGTFIQGNPRDNLVRIHYWNSVPYNERSRMEVINDIKNRCYKFGLSRSLADDSIYYYIKISECKHENGKNKGKNKITRGSIRKGVIAACLLKACQDKEHSLTPKDVAEIFEIPITTLTRGYKKFFELLGNELMQNKTTNLTSSHFTERFGNKLNMKKKHIEICKYISEQSDILGITSENTPPSVATGSLLLFSTFFNLNITKKQISTVCKISEVTVTKTYKKMLPNQKQLIPDKEIIDSIKTGDENIQSSVYNLEVKI